jgi:hypothetical protein
MPVATDNCPHQVFKMQDTLLFLLAAAAPFAGKDIGEGGENTLAHFLLALDFGWRAGLDLGTDPYAH